MSTELELVYTWSNLGTDLHEKQDTASLQCSLEFSNDDMDVQTFLHNYDRIPMPLQGYHTLYWDPSRRDNTFILGTYDGKWVSVDEQDYSIAYVQHAQLGNDMDGLPLPYVPLTHVLNDSLQQHLHEYIHAVAMNHVLFSSPHTFSMRSIAYGMPSEEKEQCRWSEDNLLTILDEEVLEKYKEEFTETKRSFKIKPPKRAKKNAEE